MDYSKILETLPHRYPMLFVDDIQQIDFGKYVRGVKCISVNEPWAQGHFPDEPVFPGVLLIETMAQIGGFMFYSDNERSLKAYLSKIEDVKFLKKIRPGDQVIVEAEFVQKVSKFVRVKCKAKVDGKIAAKGIITYYFDTNFELE